jgi:hypothetical protein
VDAAGSVGIVVLFALSSGSGVLVELSAVALPAEDPELEFEPEPMTVAPAGLGTPFWATPP